MTPVALHARLKVTLYAVMTLASLAANKPSIVATKSSSPLAILFYLVRAFEPDIPAQLPHGATVSTLIPHSHSHGFKTCLRPQGGVVEQLSQVAPLYAGPFHSVVHTAVRPPFGVVVGHSSYHERVHREQIWVPCSGPAGQAAQ